MNSYNFAAASYSNSAPLVDYLPAVSPSSEIKYGYPSSHLKELILGKVDCALIPVVHAFNNPLIKPLLNVGVASDGEVKSVLIKRKKPINEIISVLKDKASATSNKLAELILHHHFNQTVEMINESNFFDARVLIGDSALLSNQSDKDIDLSLAWKQMTGLPFIFAVWAVRSDCKYIDEINDIVCRAANVGVNSLSKIAKRFSVHQGNSFEFWNNYLKNNIHFFLTDSDINGMQLFKEMLNVNDALALNTLD